MKKFKDSDPSGDSRQRSDQPPERKLSSSNNQGRIDDHVSWHFQRHDLREKVNQQNIEETLQQKHLDKDISILDKKTGFSVRYNESAGTPSVYNEIGNSVPLYVYHGGKFGELESPTSDDRSSPDIALYDKSKEPHTVTIYTRLGQGKLSEEKTSFILNTNPGPNEQSDSDLYNFPKAIGLGKGKRLRGKQLAAKQLEKPPEPPDTNSSPNEQSDSDLYNISKIREKEKQPDTIHKFIDQLKILERNIENNDQSTRDNDYKKLNQLAEESQSELIQNLWKSHKAKFSIDQDTKLYSASEVVSLKTNMQTDASPLTTTPTKIESIVPTQKLLEEIKTDSNQHKIGRKIEQTTEFHNENTMLIESVTFPHNQSFSNYNQAHVNKAIRFINWDQKTFQTASQTTLTERTETCYPSNSPETKGSSSKREEFPEETISDHPKLNAEATKNAFLSEEKFDHSLITKAKRNIQDWRVSEALAVFSYFMIEKSKNKPFTESRDLSGEKPLNSLAIIIHYANTHQNKTVNALKSKIESILEKHGITLKTFQHNFHSANELN